MGERQLFGTDGIRGKANIYPMTCEVATALGRAVTYYFQKKTTTKTRPLIILGKDTRLSCYMLELAFSAGVCSQGGRVIMTGPLPTPGVAFVTKSMRADAGVVISASHNKFSDNGIKLFDGDGYKLPDEVELELEKMVLNSELIPMANGNELGNAIRLDEVIGRYVVQVKSNLPTHYKLDDMRIVLDCAHGAGYKVGPMVLEELGADVIPLNTSPNGENINFGCGSLYPQQCQEGVLKYRADLGICLDGDADRVVIVDQYGSVIDGDRIIGLFARLLLDQGHLQKGDEIVGTVMTNLGLEHYLKSLGLKLVRTAVGDRYIMEYMHDSGALLGGEPSGHIIFRASSSTGDGLLAGLKVIEAKKYYKKTIKELTDEVTLFPQLVKSIAVKQKKAFDKVPAVKKVLKEVEDKLGAKGRVLLRYSGTELVARVMVEGEDEVLVKESCDALVNVVTEELGKK
jgi:phosphoglucosamine mutase